MALSPKVVFLAHASTDSYFVLLVERFLRLHFETIVYPYQQDPKAPYTAILDEGFQRSDMIVAFLGKAVTDGLTRELVEVIVRRKSTILVPLGGSDASGGVAQRPEDLPYSIPAGMIDATDLTKRPFVPPCERDQQPQPLACARNIVNALARSNPEFPPWRSPDGLPQNPHLFSYEKTIIEHYNDMERFKSALTTPARTDSDEKARRRCYERVLDGCPLEWPSVTHMEKRHPGKFRRRPSPLKLPAEEQPPDRVLAAALQRFLWPQFDAYGENLVSLPNLAFLEARPPKEVIYPARAHLRVGIVVSGGIAPGINAVIDGIVQRHWRYAKAARLDNQLEISGYRNGFHGLLDGRAQELRPDDTRSHANEGGSILGTFRLGALLDENRRQETLARLHGNLRNVDVLYVIGGDGSMKAAHALWTYAQENTDRNRPPLSVIAIPKTMDNDILWVWQSFGFLSAVQKAKEIIEQLHTEVRSNPRICILQLFGSDSGFVVSHAVQASAAGQVDLALIPEVGFSMIQIAHYLKEKICERSEKGSLPHALVVMAETAIPSDATDFLGDDLGQGTGSEDQEPPIMLSEFEKQAIKEYVRVRGSGRRFQGQTSDVLRNAGLKVLMRGLRHLLTNKQNYPSKHEVVDWERLRIFDNEPRHLLRAIQPSTSDIIMAQRLGMLAVDNAMAGYSDFMISQWLTEYVLIPLDLVVLGRKRMPESGIFWQSVLEKTGQMLRPELLNPQQSSGA